MDRSFPENEIFLVITIGIIVMLLFAVAFVLFFYLSQRKFQSERLKAQQREIEHQDQLLFGNIQTQENERARIARELHDEVGSKLNVINLGLHRLQKSSAADQWDALFDVLHQTINTTRQIAHDLLPPTLKNFGLSTALEELCENYRKVSEKNIFFELHQQNDLAENHQVSLAFFRIAQELIANSIKHSKAEEMSVQLWMTHQQTRMVYRDNGCGFDTNDAALQTGLGIQNIESRARMIAAQYELKSSEGAGVYFEMIHSKSELSAKLSSEI